MPSLPSARAPRITGVGAIKMFSKLIALLMCLPLCLALSAAARTQTPTAEQTTQTQSRPEEARRMRQLIERQEARIRQLEAEKGAPAPSAVTASGKSVS